MPTLRGYQKKVVILKNTGSPLFDAAYFVLRDEGADPCADTVLDEARRIIGENIFADRRRRTHRAYPWLLFLGGALCSAAALLPWIFFG